MGLRIIFNIVNINLKIIMSIRTNDMNNNLPPWHRPHNHPSQSFSMILFAKNICFCKRILKISIKVCVLNSKDQFEICILVYSIHFKLNVFKETDEAEWNFLRCSFSDNLKKQTCLSIKNTVDLKIKMLFNFLLKNADTCVNKVVSFNLHYHHSICMLGKLTLEILISSKSSTSYNDA